MDDFEQRLARQELKRVPANWRFEVLSNAHQGRTGILPVHESVGGSEVQNADERGLRAGVALSSPGDRQDACPTLFAAVREFLRPKQILWASFASAWMAIIGLNLAATVDEGPAGGSTSRADASEIVEGVQRYQTQLAALLMENEFSEPAEEVERSNPDGPRSDAARPRRNARLNNPIYV